MVYSPDPIRMATSQDLYTWKPEGALFSGHCTSRDPNIILFNDQYFMTYVSQDILLGRTSIDLLNWSAPTEVFSMNREGVPESPFILKYENIFYLFWCIYDGTNGAYDNRTFVYYSDCPYHFDQKNLLTTLYAHAPEVVRDENGDCYIFSAEWPRRGVSAARLKWD